MPKPLLGALLAVAAACLTAMPALAATHPKIVMYATKTCGYCAKARAYFTERGVPWEERDIETSAQAAREFKSLGGVGTPLILIGDERLVGFQASKIDAALAKNTAPVRR